MKKYNLSALMHKAWTLYRKGAVSFADALRAAWVWIRVQAANAAKVQAAADALGITEEYRTWYGWQANGREVIHESKATFQVEVADPLTRKGTRINSYFLYSQTQPAPAA